MLNELRRFLPLAEKLRARNPTLSILNYMAVRDGRLMITDLENWLAIPVEDEREYTLPIDVVKQVLKSRPGEIEIDVQADQHLEIHYGHHTLGCQYLDAAEYPAWPNALLAKLGSWTGAMILQLHRQLNHASADELKPALQGVWVKQQPGRLQSCATDGHTLEYIENLDPGQTGEITRDFEGILPPKCLQILTKFPIERTHVAAGAHFIQFYLPHYLVLLSRLVDETFPDFQSILRSDNPNELTLLKGDLQRAILAALPFAQKESHVASLAVRNGTIQLAVQDHERQFSFATAIVHRGHSGTDYDVGFNLQLLQKTLAGLAGDEILWKYRDGHSANLFIGQPDNGKSNLLMPVRLEEES